MAKLALQAALTAFGVITAFALFGERLLAFLGITLPALQASGGLLLLIVALELLTGKTDEPTEVDDVNVAMVPLGTPLLAGPGAIVATILFVRQADSAPEITALILGIVLDPRDHLPRHALLDGARARPQADRHPRAHAHRGSAARRHRRAAHRGRGVRLHRRAGA